MLIIRRKRGNGNAKAVAAIVNALSEIRDRLTPNPVGSQAEYDSTVKAVNQPAKATEEPSTLIQVFS